MNGINTHPLFVYLKKQQGELLGDDIKWNFGKFLVGKNGEVIARYPPTTSPEQIVPDIEAALAGDGGDSSKGVVAPTKAAWMMSNGPSWRSCLTRDATKVDFPD